MAHYDLNDAGVRNAERLINDSKVDTSADWKDGQPSTDAENDFIDANGYDVYGEWHLAINPEAGENTKSRYAFPFGDFSKLYRDGVTSAKQRAAQYGHEEIAAAADRLLDQLGD